MSDPATKDTAASSETKVQDQSVQGELEALISEGSDQPQPDLMKGIKRVVSFVEQQEVEQFNDRFRADMDATVKAVQEVIPEEAQKFLTADMIEGQLYKRAEDDEATKKAFLGRHNNPKAWADTQKQIVDGFAEQFKQTPDKEVNEDREAVMAAAKPSGKPDDGEEMTLAEVRALPSDKWRELQTKHGVKPYGT